MGMPYPFCLVNGEKGKSQGGYTKELNGLEAARVLVATKAKPNSELGSSLTKEFYRSFVEEIYDVRGHISHENQKGNAFTAPSNTLAEFNLFLDLSSKICFEIRTGYQAHPTEQAKESEFFPCYSGENFPWNEQRFPNYDHNNYTRTKKI